VRAAIDDLCLTSDGYGFEFSQDYWPNHSVLGIYCKSKTDQPAEAALAVALDKRRTVFLLTASEEVATNRYSNIDITELAVDNFCRISTSENVQITEDNVLGYVRMFMTLHFPSRFLYLPSRSDVDKILAINGSENWQERDALIKYYRNFEQPEFRFRSNAAPFKLETWCWWYWCDLVYVYEFEIDSGGSIKYTMKRVDVRDSD
jgi:hypothetical protein